MATELTTWDPEALKKRIQETIRATYLNAIPENVWISMVEAEINHFIHGTKKVGENVTPPLTLLIREELTKIFTELLQKELRDPRYSGSMTWTNSGETIHQPGEAVKAIITKLIPEIVIATWGGVVQQVVDKLRSSRY